MPSAVPLERNIGPGTPSASAPHLVPFSNPSLPPPLVLRLPWSSFPPLSPRPPSPSVLLPSPLPSSSPSPVPPALPSPLSPYPPSGSNILRGLLARRGRRKICFGFVFWRSSVMTMADGARSNMSLPPRSPPHVYAMPCVFFPAIWTSTCAELRKKYQISQGDALRI